MDSGKHPQEHHGDGAESSKRAHSNDSSSSSASSLDELFPVDPSKSTPRSRVSSSLKHNDDDIRTQTPPVQTMDRSGNYDPHRIPSSVFGSKHSTPMEWSAASNDSLFSLNVGSYSFSREQSLFGDLSESGKAEEAYGKSSEFIMFSPGMDRNSEESVSGAGEEGNQNKARSVSPRLSGDGNCSNRSFAFPILKDVTKSDVRKPKTPPHPQQPPLPPPKQLPETPKPIERPPKSSPYNKCFCCFYSCNSCRRRRPS